MADLNSQAASLINNIGAVVAEINNDIARMRVNWTDEFRVQQRDVTTVNDYFYAISIPNNEANIALAYKNALNALGRIGYIIGEFYGEPPNAEYRAYKVQQLITEMKAFEQARYKAVNMNVAQLVIYNPGAALYSTFLKVVSGAGKKASAAAKHMKEKAAQGISFIRGKNKPKR